MVWAWHVEETAIAVHCHTQIVALGDSVITLCPADAVSFILFPVNKHF